MRRLWVFLFLAGFLLGGCSLVQKLTGKAPGGKGQVTIGLCEKPDLLLPNFPQNAAAAEVTGVLFRGLTRLDESWRPSPLYARELPPASAIKRIPPDRREVVFQLLPKMWWSDGEPMTAQDFIFAFQVALNPMFSKKRGEWVDELDAIQAPAKDRLVLRWKGNYPGDVEKFLPLSRKTNPALFLHGEPRKDMSGNGPFMLKGAQEGLLELVANPNYVPARPQVAHLLMKWFPAREALFEAIRTKSVDAVPGLVYEDGLKLIREAPDYSVYFTPSNLMKVLLFNCLSPVLGEKEVRRALLLGIDRGALLREVYPEKGELAQSWLPSQHPDYQPVLEATAYNPSEAQKILLSAGGKIPPAATVMMKAGKPLQFKLYYLGGDVVAKKIAERCGEEWKRIGILAEPAALPPEEFENALHKRTFKGAAVCTLEIPPWSTPSYAFSAARIPSSRNKWRGRNLSGWTSPKNEEICKKFDETLNQDERRQLFREHQAVFADELPYLPLYPELSVSICRKGLLNWKPRGFGEHTWNAEEWAWYQ